MRAGAMAHFGFAGITTASLLIVGCGGPTVVLEGDTFRVVHASPTHGAIEVSLAVTPIVGFNAPLDPGLVDEIQIERLGDGIRETVPSAPFLNDDGLTVELVPRRLLDPGQTYELVVSDAAASEDGQALLAPFRARFATGVDEGG